MVTILISQINNNTEINIFQTISSSGTQSLSCATQQFVRDAIGSFQSAAKCALAQRNEHIPSGIIHY